MKTRSVLAILSICGLSLQSARADDCNNNGVDDADDIYTNCTSLDLDDSGTPDECDIADGLMTDCNNNGIADWADIFGASDMCGNPVGGGSAYGGAGRDAGNGIAGGDCYGSVIEPMELGSGGGGRIALYSCSQNIPAFNVLANGGTNFFGVAEAGSIEQGSSAITIFLQPDSTTYTGGDEVSLVVDAIGDGDLSFRWRREGIPIVDDGRFSGAQTTQLTISPIDCADGGTYDCIITDDCGSFPTIPAEISVLAPSDYDNSGFVDLDDFIAFVHAFEAGC